MRNRIEFSIAILLAAASGVFAGMLDTLQVKVEIDTFSIIEYGNEKTGLALPRSHLWGGPEAFDIDDSGNLFILNRYDSTLMKFKKDSLIARKKVNDDILDMKYANGKVYIYSPQNLYWVKSNGFTQMSAEPLNRYCASAFKKRFASISYFYDSFLFLIDYDFTNGNMKTTLALRLGDTIQSKTVGDTSFLPIIECKNCNMDFIRDVFYERDGYSFCGQNERFVLLERIKGTSRGVTTKVLLYSKSYGELYAVEPLSFTIDGSSQRPACFINENTAVIQTLEMVGRKHNRVCYYRLKFQLPDIRRE